MHTPGRSQMPDSQLPTTCTGERWGGGAQGWQPGACRGGPPPGRPSCWQAVPSTHGEGVPRERPRAQPAGSSLAPEGWRPGPRRTPRPVWLPTEAGRGAARMPGARRQDPGKRGAGPGRKLGRPRVPKPPTQQSPHGQLVRPGRRASQLHGQSARAGDPPRQVTAHSGAPVETPGQSGGGRFQPLPTGGQGPPPHQQRGRGLGRTQPGTQAQLAGAAPGASGPPVPPRASLWQIL